MAPTHLNHRFATERDLGLLAEWNHQLIHDEGHRNPMTVSELQERLKGWLCGEYKAVIFGPEADPLAYALYRESADEVYLRQFFVRRDRRSQGVGHAAMQALRTRIWPQQKRLTVEVLVTNTRGLSFWRTHGYKDYALTLEIRPTT